MAVQLRLGFERNGADSKMTANNRVDWLAVPVSLVGACIAGVTLVMALQLLPSADFRDLEKASKGWVKEEGSQYRSLPVQDLPSVYRGVQGTPGALEVVAQQERENTIRARVAANILLRSGLIFRAQAVDDPPHGVAYRMEAHPDSLTCARTADAAAGSEREVGTRLAIAAIAVETTYRNSFQRWLEMRIAELSLATLGHL